MSEAVPPGTGLVAALLGLSADVVKAVCQEAASVGVVAAANFNSPGQVVIAGEKAAVERAIEIAKTKGCKKAIPLPVSVPVHTPLMQKAADRLAGEFGGVVWRDLTVPLVNNAEATALQRSEDIRASLVRQLPSSVRWEESVQTMAKLGVTTFVLKYRMKEFGGPIVQSHKVDDPGTGAATLCHLNYDIDQGLQPQFISPGCFRLHNAKESTLGKALHHLIG